MNQRRGAATALLLPLLATGPVCAADDDWLGAPQEANSRLLVWGGGDADGGRSTGIDATVPIAALRLYARAEQNSSVSGDTTLNDDWRSLGLGSDPDNAFTLRLDAAQHGETQVAEFTEYRLELSALAGAWDFTGHLMTGTVELFLRADRGRLLPRRESGSMDRQAAGLAVGYLTGALHVDAAYTHHTYSEDLSTLSAHPLLELALGPVTVGHTAALPDEEFSCGVEAAVDPWDLGVRYQQSRSMMDGARLQSAHLRVGRRVSETFTVSLRGIAPLDGGAGYGELALDVLF